MRRPLLLLALCTACGSRPAITTSKTLTSSSIAPVVVSPACVAAREVRAKAVELDLGGHEVLALAKIDEANGACPGERATSEALEAVLLANIGVCSRARALSPGGDAGATAKRVTTICDALEAPPKGTEASMRAKTREAYAKERAKDFAGAKALYLEAWTELHPNPRALENAARMATLAGDAAESRRLRDRTLAEAEATEHAPALLTNRVRVVRGAPRLVGTTLLLAEDGKVVARDTQTGELRVLLDASGADMTLSPSGTLAIAASGANAFLHQVSVFDVLSGALLFKVDNVSTYAASPDDTLLAIHDMDDRLSDHAHLARIIDVATGQVKSSLSGKWNSLTSFSPDDSHVLLFGDDNDMVFRQWDTAKQAYVGGVRLRSTYGVGATSANGQFFAYVESPDEAGLLHVRDMVANKEIAVLNGRFTSVSALGISPDGKTVATGSYSSLRLWDVATKKQLFKDSTRGRDADSFAFSDDGKTMVLAGFARATAWDVATGAEKTLVADQSVRKVLHVAPAPDGVAVLLEDEAQIISASGEVHTACQAAQPSYLPIMAPTNVAFSASGKSMACSMADGWVRVIDTTTWTERAVIKKRPESLSLEEAAEAARKRIARPVDLVFSSDDKTLSVVSDTNIVTYDAQTAAETKRVAFKHPFAGLAPRHARFADGTIAIRLWNGSAAIFGADGTYQRDVKLLASAPIEALDEFAADGKTYVAALGKVLHVVDLAGGGARTVELPSQAKGLSVSPDGKSIAVAGADGVVTTVSNGAVSVLPRASGTRVALVGPSVAVWSKDTIDLFAPGATPISLELGSHGMVGRDASGAFDVRGTPELQCVVGKTFLTRETCAERAKDGIVAAWLKAAR
ncbi:MAG TPA: WD40 repeat domain-containing protein [Polyangiaceae bacterium]